jgi:hypothetical protein
MSEEPRKPNIDERIEALVMTAELAEKRLQATEKEQRRLRAAMRAALAAWATYEEDEETK